jgi:hypothetical protein
LIEEKGMIPRSEVHAECGPLGPLAKRLADRVSLPLSFVEIKLRKLADRKCLLCREEDGMFRWEWRQAE